MAGQEQVVESFAPTNGQASGWFGVAMGVVIALGGLLRPDGGVAWPVAVAGALVAWVMYAFSIRPRVWLTGRHLVLRHTLDRVLVPLAAVEQLSISRVLSVRTADRRYVSAALGRPAVRAGRRGSPEPGVPFVDYAEGRLRRAVEEASGAAAGAADPAEPVRREPEWLVIAVAGGLLALLVLTLAL